MITASRVAVGFGTSIYNGKPALCRGSCEFLRKRVVQVASVDGAHARDVRIGIRALDNFVLPRFYDFRILIDFTMTPSPSSSIPHHEPAWSVGAVCEKVGYLWSGHSGAGITLREVGDLDLDRCNSKIFQNLYDLLNSCTQRLS
jgi:hypothetical protein